MENIDIFKNIVYYLREWYMEKLAINKEEFNECNDLNILKIIKLHFFVVAINSKENPLLLDKNNFYAMPYGPVETNVYNTYKQNPNFTHFNLSNENVVFNNNQTFEVQENDYSNAIIQSILKLKELEPELILADAGSLVELTHTWNSWKKYYGIAKSVGKYSYPIPPEEIKNDVKIVNLNFVNS